MKYYLITLFFSLLLLTACEDRRKSPHETIDLGNISISYGRPAKKGRKIFGDLVPYQQVWRAGADEATEISFRKDGFLGERPVKAGTYTLFVLPDEKSWTIILNGQLRQWGAFEYDKNKAKNVLSISAPVQKPDSTVESFTIRPAQGGIIFEWENTLVYVPAS